MDECPMQASRSRFAECLWPRRMLIRRGIIDTETDVFSNRYSCNLPNTVRVDESARLHPEYLLRLAYSRSSLLKSISLSALSISASAWMHSILPANIS